MIELGSFAKAENHFRPDPGAARPETTKWEGRPE